MDVKPWQHESNQHKVRPFKFVLTTRRKWRIALKHTIRRRRRRNGWMRTFVSPRDKKEKRKRRPNTKSATRKTTSFTLTDKSICVNSWIWRLEVLHKLDGDYNGVFREKQVSLHRVLPVFISWANNNLRFGFSTRSHLWKLFRWMWKCKCPTCLFRSNLCCTSPAPFT